MENKKDRVWMGIDFDALDKEIEEKRKTEVKVSNPNDVYVKIIKDLANELIGDGLIYVETNDDSSRIFISITPKDSCGYHCHTIFTEDGYYIFDKNLKFNSLDFFKEYARQIIEVKCKNEIFSLYKSGIIEEHKSIKSQVFNLDKITKEWFINEFESIAEDRGNSETLDDVKIENVKNGIEISFSIDCGRYGSHDDNLIKVSNRGNVQTYLSEIIEGGDIDGGIKRSIENLIK